MKGSGRDPHVIARSSRPFGLLVFLFPHKSLSCFYKCLVSFLLQPLPVNSCDKIICSALFLAPWFQHKHIGNIYVYGFSITPGSRYVYIRICPYDLILKKKKINKNLGYARSWRCFSRWKAARNAPTKNSAWIRGAQTENNELQSRWWGLEQVYRSFILKKILLPLSDNIRL